MIDFIYSYITGLIEVSIEFLFLNQYLHAPIKKITKTIFFIILSSIVIQLPFSTLLKLMLFAALLFLYSTWILKTNIKVSAFCTILTIELMQLCYGILNSISTILSFFIYHLNPSLFSFIFMIAGDIFSLILSIFCYQIVCKYMAHKENTQNQYVLMMIIPLLMIFVVSGYIHFTFYGNTQSISAFFNKNYISIFIIQSLGIVSIFSILYAYQKLIDSFFLYTKFSMLTQQAHFQEQYVKEAQTHYSNTKALRHDMKNHITIIKGLLDKEEFLKAKTYIEQLNIATATTTFSFPTNNPILDILLENKIALANSKIILYKMNTSIQIHPNKQRGFIN